MFPNYKIEESRGFLGIKRKKRVPDGWEDHGEVYNHLDVCYGYGPETYFEEWEFHKFCRSKVHIGRDKERMFKFCPECMITVDDYPSERISKTATEKYSTSRGITHLS